MPPGSKLTLHERADVQALWDYHHLGHKLAPTDVGIGLGSHDIGVAVHAAELFHQGMFATVVFTGANAPTTVERFPRGEAVHYREVALSLGVPDRAIVVEPHASCTIENIRLARQILELRGNRARSITLISRPYQQRRAYGIACQLWPGVDITCSAQQVRLGDYLAQIGDIDLVVNTIVADTHRLAVDHAVGCAVSQTLPSDVRDAYSRLVKAGYNARIDGEAYGRTGAPDLASERLPASLSGA